MLYETCACIRKIIAHADRTGLRQVSGAYCMTDFACINFVDFQK